MFNIFIIIMCILSFIGIIILYSCYKNETKIQDCLSFQQAMELTDLPIITFYCGQRKLNFIIDTGSIYSVIDNNIIKNKEIPVEKTNNVFKMITATGKDNVDNEFGNIQLYLNENEFVDEFVLSDSIHETFEYLKSLHGVTIHGLLGSKFFNKYKYIIDFNKFIFYRK